MMLSVHLKERPHNMLLILFFLLVHIFLGKVLVICSWVSVVSVTITSSFAWEEDGI